jgi:hypothetical protein
MVWVGMMVAEQAHHGSIHVECMCDSVTASHCIPHRSRMLQSVSDSKGAGALVQAVRLLMAPSLRNRAFANLLRQDLTRQDLGNDLRKSRSYGTSLPSL